MFIATIVLAVVLAGAFFMFGAGKIADLTMMAEARHHLGIPAGIFKMVGVLEVLGAVGVLAGLHADLPLIGVLAGIGLVAMTIGAVFYHQKAGDSMKEWLPAVVVGSVAIIYVILRIGSS